MWTLLLSEPAAHLAFSYPSGAEPVGGHRQPGDKSLCPLRWASFNNLLVTPSSPSNCGPGMLMRTGDPGTATADPAIKNNWAPVMRRRNVSAFGLAGKCG